MHRYLIVSNWTGDTKLEGPFDSDEARKRRVTEILTEDDEHDVFWLNIDNSYGNCESLDCIGEPTVGEFAYADVHPDFQNLSTEQGPEGG